MFVHEVRLRARYAETDQMGQMYYGRYAELFEVGRVEALRALGFPYSELEARGILLPVSDFSVRYIKPVRYDQEVTIRTMVIEPITARIRFRYEVLGLSGGRLTVAETTLVFVDAATKRPCRAPADLVAALAPHLH